MYDYEAWIERMAEASEIDAYLDKNCPGWRDEIVFAEELTDEEMIAAEGLEL